MSKLAIYFFAALVFSATAAQAKSWTYAYTVCPSGQKSNSLLYVVGSMPVDSLKLTFNAGTYLKIYSIGERAYFGTSGNFMTSTGTLIMAEASVVSGGDLDSVGVKVGTGQPGKMTSYEYSVTPEYLTLRESSAGQVLTGCESTDQGPTVTGTATHVFN